MNANAIALGLATTTTNGGAALTAAGAGHSMTAAGERGAALTALSQHRTCVVKFPTDKCILLSGCMNPMCV